MNFPNIFLIIKNDNFQKFKKSISIRSPKYQIHTSTKPPQKASINRNSTPITSAKNSNGTKAALLRSHPSWWWRWRGSVSVNYDDGERHQLAALNYSHYSCNLLAPDKPDDPHTTLPNDAPSPQSSCDTVSSSSPSWARACRRPRSVFAGTVYLDIQVGVVAVIIIIAL